MNARAKMNAGARVGMLAAVMLVALFVAPRAAAAELHVIPVTGTIDYGLAAFVARAIRGAEEAGASAVVLSIDTPGGLVNAALRARDAIVASKVRTIAYVNPRAWSAGALLAIACETLVMNPGGSMGAAETRPNEEKYISAVRAEFEATAGLRGRDPQLAGAMVDADIEIPGLVSRGKILTLTATKATELGFADEVATGIEELAEKLGLAEAEIVDVQSSTAERVARWLTNDAVSQVLLTIGLVGLAVEALTPGFGVPGAIGLTSMGLFFGGRLLGGLAGWEAVAVFLVGFALLLIELFLIPGFGVTGILGIVGVFASLVLSYPTPAQAMSALAVALVGGAALSALTVGLLTRGGRLRGRPGRIVLRHEERVDKGYLAVERLAGVDGAEGVAVTALKPVGTVDFDGRRVQAISEGGFILAGTRVRVVRVEGSNVFVRVTEL